MARRPIPVPIHTTTSVSERDYISMLIATGAVKVKRYLEAPRPTYRSKHGGALPADLNPVTLGSTLEEVEQAERERIADTHNRALSRRQRVHGSRKIRKVAARDAHEAATDALSSDAFGREQSRFA